MYALNWQEMQSMNCQVKPQWDVSPHPTELPLLIFAHLTDKSFLSHNITAQLLNAEEVFPKHIYIYRLSYFCQLDIWHFKKNKPGKCRSVLENPDRIAIWDQWIIISSFYVHIECWSWNYKQPYFHPV